MKKIEEILIKQPYQLICVFNDKEKRSLDLKNVISKDNKYFNKILNPDILHQIKIGKLGELYWENLAEMRNLNGDLIKCAYDISPDLAYMKSKPVEKELETDY